MNHRPNLKQIDREITRQTARFSAWIFRMIASTNPQKDVPVAAKPLLKKLGEREFDTTSLSSLAEPEHV